MVVDGALVQEVDSSEVRGEAERKDIAALARAQSRLKANDLVGAASAAEEVLAGLDFSVLSSALVVRGKALLASLLLRSDEPGFNEEEFREPSKIFLQAWRLDPQNAEANLLGQTVDGMYRSFKNVANKVKESFEVVVHNADELDKVNRRPKDKLQEVVKASGRTLQDCEQAPEPIVKVFNRHGRNIVDNDDKPEDDEFPLTIRFEFLLAEKKAPRLIDGVEPLDVLVVGAGASGIGMALMLTRTFGLDPERVLLVERGEGTGETFRRWPREMHFISPSFNHQGWTNSFDLNSVAYGTSPAFTLHAEHPTGEQYARYLCALADAGGLHVRARTEVTAVQPKDGGFNVSVVPADAVHASRAETLRSRYVIWAAGEFQYPRANMREPSLFPGSELCLHNSSVRSWAELPGDDFVVIGGYESGMDAAFNLASNGKHCTVVSSTPYWRVTTADPSTELAPYTAERVRKACAMSVPPRLLAPLRVFAVQRLEACYGDGSGYLVRARWGPNRDDDNLMGIHREPLPASTSSHAAAAAVAEPTDSTEGAELSLRTPQPPLLCTGFGGSIALGVVKELFEWDRAKKEDGKKDNGEAADANDEDCEDNDGEKGGNGGCAEGSPLLTLHDESTKTPGLFLVGPAVRHGEFSFCFIYKFRQRFGIVADAIARGLGNDTQEAVEVCRKMNMFMDDFTCCQAACGESC